MTHTALLLLPAAVVQCPQSLSPCEEGTGLRQWDHCHRYIHRRNFAAAKQNRHGSCRSGCSDTIQSVKEPLFSTTKTGVL